MTTNQARALRLLNDLAENQDGAGVFDAVAALADAGLIAPDLPRMVWPDEHHPATDTEETPEPAQPRSEAVAEVVRLRRELEALRDMVSRRASMSSLPGIPNQVIEQRINSILEGTHE